LVHAREAHRNLLEQTLNIMTRLSGGLHEKDIQLLRLGSGLFESDLSTGILVHKEDITGVVYYAPLVGKVGFVANKYDDYVVTALRTDIVYPFCC
jgi:hypothetical protein